MTEFFALTGILARWAWDAVLRLPHLYALGALYWSGLLVFLVQRYGRKRMRSSVRIARGIQLTAVVGVAVAAVDLAVRHHVEFVHLSLLAYLATALGVARLVVRRLDRRRTPLWAAFRLRATTFGVLIVGALALTALAGDPWWLQVPRFSGRSLLEIMTDTNWLHLAIVGVGLALVLDIAVTASGRTPWGRRADHL